MRYELTDREWAAISPMLPNKPRGVPRVNDRRVLNGIFWVLRSGAPWRDLPQEFGPYTTCYNRFIRWRRAGVWSRIMAAFAAIARNRKQSMGRSRGGLTSKIHAMVDSNGLPSGSRLQPEKRTTTGSRSNFCLASNREQCYSPTVAMTRTGSEPSPPRGALGPTSRRNAIARSRCVSARISTEPAT